MSWFAPIIEFCIKLVPTIQSTALAILDFMVTSVSIAGVEYSVYDLLFGYALLIIFGYALISFITGIIT